MVPLECSKWEWLSKLGDQVQLPNPCVQETPGKLVGNSGLRIVADGAIPASVAVAIRMTLQGCVQGSECEVFVPLTYLS